MVFYVFNSHITRFPDIFNSRLLYFNQHYSRTLERKKTEAEAEIEVATDDHTKAKEYLTMMLRWQDERAQDWEENINNIHSEAMLDCDSKVPITISWPQTYLK